MRHVQLMIVQQTQIVRCLPYSVAIRLFSRVLAGSNSLRRTGASSASQLSQEGVSLIEILLKMP